MRHLVFHKGSGGFAGEDTTIGQCGIEASMLGLGEPDEVGGSVVGGDTVEVVAFVAPPVPRRDLRSRRCPLHGLRTYERKGDGVMNKDAAVIVS